MAGSSLLTLIDDIATLLDDISIMTKIAAKKTAGVLGDDLALNAEQVSGVRAERELPVVWAVFKGSVLNKLILVPAALTISAIVPAAITPLLMIGGCYLCYEGFEKIAHKFLHSRAEEEAEHEEMLGAVADPEVDLVQFERRKIKGAIRTDFILSAEIIVIALGTVKDAELVTRIAVVAAIAAVITVGVYGLVAAIVKLDDLGLYLLKQKGESVGGAIKRRLGGFILRLAPWLMKALAVVGTAAMFLVGGGILVHGIAPAANLLHHLQEMAQALPTLGNLASGLTSLLFNGLAGIVAGGILVAVISLLMKLWPKKG